MAVHSHFNGKKIEARVELSKLQEIVKDREAWHAAFHGVIRNPTRLSDWITRIQIKRIRSFWSKTLSAAAAAKSLQSCPTLCDPIDGSLPGSAIPGILQARTLEWVAISFSNAWKWKVKVKSLSRVWLFTTPWTAVYQAPPPMRGCVNEKRV